jgi:transketolase
MKNILEKSTKGAYGEVIIEIGKQNKNVVVLTADLMHSTNVEGFKKQFPERFFNFGMAEQNMMGAAAGLATCGKIPFVSTFACFASMRSCEQIRTDIAYPRLNVKIVVTHAGISMGAGGTTHHAIEDIAMMRSIANMTVIVPSDAVETEKTIKAATKYPGPVYIRLGRDPDPIVNPQNYEYEIGKASILKEGKDVIAIAMGRMVAESLDAAAQLKEDGIEVGVINMHTIKPIDKETIMEAAKKTKLIVTVEEHNIVGGLGSAVTEVIAQEQRTCCVKRIGIPDIFVTIGSYKDLLSKYKLNGNGIAEQIKKWL